MGLHQNPEFYALKILIDRIKRLMSREILEIMYLKISRI